MLNFELAQSDNRPRKNSMQGVESWFFRANHPDKAQAIWIKATTLGSKKGDQIAEVWCSVFDEDETWAAKKTLPQNEATFQGTPLEIKIGDASFQLSAKDGRLQGRLEKGQTFVEWDLHYSAIDNIISEPFSILPTRRLIDAPFPKNKLLTPAPVIKFSGTINWNGKTIIVENWLGSQGHNWGAAHAKEYAWGQCIFTDSQNTPFAYVEAASAKIEIAKQTTPFLSMMVIRYYDQEYRFDRLVDVWNQSADLDFPRWSLKMKGPQGEALLTMEARPERMVCLGYENPNGELSYCLNSKTAALTLSVNPINNEAFECTSRSAGALEFLQSTEVSSVQPVI